MVIIFCFVLGSDPLLQILYETDKPQETHDVMALQEIPAVWRYRDMISVNHLRQHIGAAKLKLPVLRLFLQEVTIDFKNLNLGLFCEIAV